MKAMSKSELADAAGVSVKVLMNRVLPPKIVKFIAEKFCIDIDD